MSGFEVFADFLSNKMKTTKSPHTPPDFFLGIDIGKDDLYCHLIGPVEAASERFDNSTPGIKALLKWLAKHTSSAPFAACMERTGHYGDAIAEALYRTRPEAIHLVNPQRIKSFGMQKLRRNKSDTADAKLIARFLQAEIDELRPWEPKTPVAKRIENLGRFAESLTQDIARMKTTIQSQSDTLIRATITRQIKTFEKDLGRIRQEIDKLISADESFRRKNELLQSIPGIGQVAAQTLLGELPDLDLFEDARQLAAWAGLTPRHFVSGTSGKRNTPITKVGSNRLRRCLYMPAMAARTYNPLLKEFAQRLSEGGKTPKQIIIAVMRKLLHQIYGILKSGERYNPEKRGFHSPSKPLPLPS
jgi:transposase